VAVVELVELVMLQAVLLIQTASVDLEWLLLLQALQYLELVVVAVVAEHQQQAVAVLEEL
jgi:hypothetical protein